MKNVFDILTSRARIVILRTLYFQEEPIPLRHVSLIADLPVFSVQNAISLLLDEKIISRSEEGNNVLLKLNEKHLLYDIMGQIFITEINARICLEARMFYQKAERVLEFASDANIIFKRAKRKRKIK